MSETQTAAKRENPTESLDWGVQWVQWTPEAPIQGFVIDMPGKCVPVATAGGVQVEKNLVLGPEYQHMAFAREHFTSEEVKAIGLLIAAAPNLLAACKAALPRLNARRFDTAAHDDVVTQLEAAIAKATPKD